MKKVLLSLLIFLLFPLSTFAQEDGLTYEEYKEMSDDIEKTQESEDTQSANTLVNNDYFQLELIRKVQSPFNKKIPFGIKITPKIDSPKTQIIWNTQSVFTVEKDHPEFVSLSKDQTYTYSAKLIPNKEGTYNISVTVVSWQFNSNKSATVNYSITLSKSHLVQPIDTLYIVYNLLLVLGILGVSALAIYLVTKSIKTLVKRAKIWLTPPI